MLVLEVLDLRNEGGVRIGLDQINKGKNGNILWPGCQGASVKMNFVIREASTRFWGVGAGQTTKCGGMNFRDVDGLEHSICLVNVIRTKIEYERKSNEGARVLNRKMQDLLPKRYDNHVKKYGRAYARLAVLSTQ